MSKEFKNKNKQKKRKGNYTTQMTNVNVLGIFYKYFLTSQYRSILFGIFLKPDSKQKYLQVKQRKISAICLFIDLFCSIGQCPNNSHCF